MSALQKKRKELRLELNQIEKQIFDLETNYLEETRDFGNIFTGWSAYISNDKVKSKKSILYEDRLFSLSSVNSPASKKEESKKSAKKIGSAVKATTTTTATTDSSSSTSKKKKKTKSNTESSTIIDLNTGSVEVSAAISNDSKED